MTRWYRAPELILLQDLGGLGGKGPGLFSLRDREFISRNLFSWGQDNYTEAIDVWSVGQNLSCGEVL